MKLKARIGAVLPAACAAVLACPAPAFAAEESGGGIDILVPKVAEFVPALIAFVVIWIFMAKFAMPKIVGMMDERGQRIADDLDAAKSEKEQAAAERKTAEEIVTDARRQAADIVLEARRDAEEERSRILSAAHAEAEDIVAKAHANVEEERRAALADATESVANLSVSVASKIVGDVLTEEDQKRLVEKYLKEAGSLNA